MSINSMTNCAAARRMDFVPFGQLPKGYQQLAYAASQPLPYKVSETVSSAKVSTQSKELATPANTSGSVDTALHIIFGFIPTEILTLYVAVLAVIQQPNQITRADWIAFWFFLIATPFVVWAVFAAKLKSVGKPLPRSYEDLPIWEMVAAAVAFAIWAFALPHSPFAQFSWYSASLSGVMVLVASTFLGLISPFFQRTLGKKSL